MTTPIHRWRAFALLAVAFFVTIADLAIVNVALPTIGRELHFSESNLQWVVTAYGLTFGGFLLLGGRAADLLGRRRIFMIGLVVFTLASLACGLSTNDWTLIAMRGVQGLGAAIILPAALSIVMNMFDGGRRAEQGTRAVGRRGRDRRDVRRARRRPADPLRRMGVHLLPQRPDRRRRLSADPAGRSGEPPRRSPETVRPARRAVGHRAGWCSSSTRSRRRQTSAGRRHARSRSSPSSMVLLAAFVAIEARVEAPLMPLRIFKLKTLTGANVVGFLLGGSFFAFIFVGTLYMQQVLHYSAIETGLAWLATSLTSVAFAGLSQALVTRRSPKVVMALGMTMIGAGLLWTTQAGHGHYWSSLFGPFFVTGVGTAFAFIPISIAALAGVEEREAGLASGLINTSQQLGGALGVAVASTVVAAHVKTLTQQGDTASAALAGGLRWALCVTGVTALVAVVATFLLVRSDELEQAVEAATASATA